MSFSLTIITRDKKTLVREPEYLEVNMSNRNAADVLAALGHCLDCDNTQTFTLQGLWADCNAYLTSELALVSDMSLATVQDGNTIECGRREGYVTERIKQIKATLEWAMLNSQGAFCYFI
jgi:hypothetical protein